MNARKRRYLEPFTVLMTFLFLCLPCTETPASSSHEAVRSLQVDQIKSWDEMKAAVLLLTKSVGEGISSKAFPTDIQNQILMKSGECISKIISIDQGAVTEERHRLRQKELFTSNGEVIRKILKLNEKTIEDFQEHHLDQMEDPLIFIKSPQWQEPQFLISLASYWLGWNGYYCSLVMPETDRTRGVLLQEAVKGFSRAIIDFKEDAVIAKSLLGRGLCYRQIKEYDRAARDFKLVRQKTDKDNVLHSRSRYEDAMISYLTENYSLALRSLDEIQEDFPGNTMPQPLRTSIYNLRAKVLIGLITKQTREDKNHVPDKNYERMFQELNQLAMNGYGKAVFYRYAQENREMLSRFSYSDLGPVAAMALADGYFEAKAYDPAMRYYLRLHEDSPSVVNEDLDKVWFRIPYIYCKKEQWASAIHFLQNFIEKFQDSSLLESAVSLYYMAAYNHYQETATEDAYETFIKSVHLYLRDCAACPDQSEARYQLGLYYQARGMKEQAINEYLKVGKDSPNFVSAGFLVLQAHVKEMEFFEKGGQDDSELAEKQYEKGIRLLNAIQGTTPEQKKAVKQIEPHLIILQAKMCHFGPDDGCDQMLILLKDFEQHFSQEKALCFEAVKLRMACYSRLQMHREAEAEVDQFIEASPLDEQRYGCLYDLAENTYRKSTELKKRRINSAADSYATIALMVYHRLYGVARKNPAYGKYLETVQLRMAQICISQDRLDAAVEIYRDILKRNSLSADAVYNLGLLYEKMGQWQDALATWRKFSDGTKVGTHHWFESRYKTARALFELGKKDRACDVLTMTLVLHPDLADHELKKLYLDLKSKSCKGSPQHAEKD